MIVVFLGPSGCGKGTQAEYLKQNHGFIHISTGDLLRAEQDNKTEIGLQIAEDMANGKLISDDIILALVNKQLDLYPESSLLFDGFPRTLPQAEALENVLREAHKEISCVVDFSVSEKDLYARIEGRFICVKCSALYHDPHRMPREHGVCDVCSGTEFTTRPDDKPEVLAKRLEWFKNIVAPVRAFYKQKDLLKTLDASQPIEQVREEILSFLHL